MRGGRFVPRARAPVAMTEADDEAWRAGGSWEPPERPHRWPPFVAAMLPCGAAAFVLGHRLRAFPLPLEVASFALVVLACAAPLLATYVSDAMSARFDEGLSIPPRAFRERCLALALGAVAAAFVPSIAVALSLGAAGYEIVALRGAWRAERSSRMLR